MAKKIFWTLVGLFLLFWYIFWESYTIQVKYGSNLLYPTVIDTWFIPYYITYWKTNTSYDWDRLCATDPINRVTHCASDCGCWYGLKVDDDNFWRFIVEYNWGFLFLWKYFWWLYWWRSDGDWFHGVINPEYIDWWYLSWSKYVFILGKWWKWDLAGHSCLWVSYTWYVFDCSDLWIEPWEDAIPFFDKSIVIFKGGDVFYVNVKDGRSFVRDLYWLHSFILPRFLWWILENSSYWDIFVTNGYSYLLVKWKKYYYWENTGIYVPVDKFYSGSVDWFINVGINVIYTWDIKCWGNRCYINYYKFIPDLNDYAILLKEEKDSWDSWDSWFSWWLCEYIPFVASGIFVLPDWEKYYPYYSWWILYDSGFSYEISWIDYSMLSDNNLYDLLSCCYSWWEVKCIYWDWSYYKIYRYYVVFKPYWYFLNDKWIYFFDLSGNIYDWDLVTDEVWWYEYSKYTYSEYPSGYSFTSTWWCPLPVSFWGGICVWWGSFFWFGIPKYCPFENFWCLISIIKYSFDVDFPILNLFSSWRNVFEWKVDVDYSNKRWIKLGDLFIFIILFLIYFYFIMRFR